MFYVYVVMFTSICAMRVLYTVIYDVCIVMNKFFVSMWERVVEAIL
jgi:hypothetical protein